MTAYKVQVCIKAQVYSEGNNGGWQTETHPGEQDDFFSNSNENEFRNFFNNEENDVFLNEYELNIIRERERKKIEEKKKQELAIQKAKEEQQKKEEEFKTFVYEQYLFENLLYGIAAGGVIGVTIAKSYAQDTRETFQYIGTGLVLGAMIGIAVGSREIYFYDVPPDVASADTDKYSKYDRYDLYTSKSTQKTPSKSYFADGLGVGFKIEF
ncbi:hypothetical protein CHS0354_030088 [Potamilus streckersoni]|uniref:Uncharacterized protein n=1 Tax=Potamilus streckersoni TaxID=2493646 RepID=A0AAE0RL39_9BIVA|nr:hypothetical protein CHS0354_030088 [Potamilus streckersoni]